MRQTPRLDAIDLLSRFQRDGFGDPFLVASACGIGFENALDLVTNMAKDRELILVCALCLGWIVKPPMVAIHLAWENGTGLVGVSAHGDDGLYRLLTKEFVQMLGFVSGNIDPNFPHDLDGFRMNVTGRLRASALNVDEITRGLSQNAFREMTTARIAGAEYKNGWLIAQSMHRCRDSGGSLMANLDSLATADFFGSGFQTQNVELLERERGQELQPASYLLGDLPEGSPLFCIRTFHGSRIWRTPVRENRLARPNRAAFLGVVTQGDNEIEGHIFEIIPRFAMGIRCVDLEILSKNF